MLEATKIAKKNNHIFSDCQSIVLLINKNSTLKNKYTYLNSFIKEIILNKNTKNISIKWKKRHSNILLKTADNLAYSKAKK